jgi:hypothetical protein
MDKVINNMKDRDNDDLPNYFKSFGLGCYYDWDRTDRWYDVSWKDKRYIQVQCGTSVDRFIKLMIEYFTDAWDTPPIYLASNRNKKQLFKFCSLFPEFNQKIIGLNINLTD